MTFLKLLFLTVLLCPPLYAASYATYRNVAYGTNLQQDMDIYQPSSSTPLPLIILIHGGAWVSGDKQNLSRLASFWIKNGYVVANVNYRLASPGVNEYPDNIDDITSAIAWLKINAVKYNINTNKIIALGTSAGGYLAEEEAQLNNVQATVVFYGPNNLEDPVFLSNLYNGYTNAEFCNVYLGYTLEQNPSLYFNASPINFISSKYPPTILFHGEEDTVVPVAQDQILYDALIGLAVKAQLVIVPNAGHGFLTQPSTDATVYQQQALEFLDGLAL